LDEGHDQNYAGAHWIDQKYKANKLGKEAQKEREEIAAKQ